MSELRRPAWYGWGEPDRQPSLPRRAASHLARSLGVEMTRHTPPVDIDLMHLPDVVLAPGTHQRLAGVVGAEGLLTDPLSRIQHAAGRSYLDLVRLRAGDVSTAPDTVVMPTDHDQVRAVLEVCAADSVAVVPFGGGTSVVGGVAPHRARHAAVVALDLGRLDQVVAVDETSMTATLQAGMRGPDVERALRARGLTLGHWPQSFVYSTVGGWLATRSAGQASTGYGAVGALVVGLRCATPVGDLTLGRGPASAAGPRLLDLMIGSEGVFGVITDATLLVRRRPAVRRYEGWSFPDLPSGLAAMRALAQQLGSGVAPDVCRLSDPDETSATFSLSAGRMANLARGYLTLRGHGSGCLAIVGWEGERPAVVWRRRAAIHALRAHHGISLGAAPGLSWLKDRFSGPYLRDTLLDRGLLVETLETAASWSAVPTVHAAVRAALTESLTAAGTPPLVLCHVSHLYRAGASLYFTVLARRDVADPAGQWLAAKRAAMDAIVAGGATITHHHAVGADHRDWLPAEVGDLGIRTLRAVKAALDPAGILNPGKLLPEGPVPEGPVGQV